MILCTFVIIVFREIAIIFPTSELDAAVKQISKNNNNNNVAGVQGDVSNLADLCEGAERAHRYSVYKRRHHRTRTFRINY
jgi:hypothetical protein